MQLLFGTLAASGFLAALGVHIAALAGVPVQDHVRYVWGLHVGIFLVFIPAIVYLKRHTEPSDPFALFRGLPAWVVLVLISLFLYAFFNFFASLATTGGAVPEARDGQYVLRNKGQTIRAISLAEYKNGRAAQMRLFSGHWLLFYALPTAVFLFRRRPSEA